MSVVKGRVQEDLPSQSVGIHQRVSATFDRLWCAG